MAAIVLALLRRWHLLPLAGAAVLGVVITVACGDSYGSDPDVEDEAGVAAGDTEADAAVSPADPCLHVVPPSAPETEDEGPSLPPFAIAIDSLVVGGAVGTGFDLDGVCTCDPRPGTAFDGGDTCGSVKKCDLDGGIDNALAPLSQQFRTFFDFDAFYARAIGNGRGNTILQIADYNGRANDKDVNVALLLAEGIPEKGCPTSMTDPETGRFRPGWCGDDTWTIFPRSFLVPGVPNTVLKAFVRDGVLVLRSAPGAAVDFGALGTEYRDLVAVGKLVPLGEDLNPRDPAREPTEREKRLFRLDDAILGGRLAARSLVASVGGIDIGDGGKLCETPTFAAAKGYVCGAADIATSSDNDRNVHGPCEAVSVGMQFSAKPVLIGALAEGDLPPTRCTANADWSTDAGVSYLCD